MQLHYDGVPLARVADCPPVVWINLARAGARRARMQAMLDGLGLRHQRVEAVDGAEVAERRGAVVAGAGGTAAENACTASHLLAMARFLAAHPGEPRALVLEDDATFELARHWRASLGEYLRRGREACPGVAVTQLCVMHAHAADLGAHMDRGRPVPRAADNWFSTCAYVVERAAAERLVARFVRAAPDGSLVADLSAPDAGVVHADLLLYRCAGGPVLAAPLLSYTCAESFIHPHHVDSHAACKRRVEEWWQAA